MGVFEFFSSRSSSPTAEGRKSKPTAPLSNCDGPRSPVTAATTSSSITDFPVLAIPSPPSPEQLPDTSDEDNGEKFYDPHVPESRSGSLNLPSVHTGSRSQSPQRQGRCPRPTVPESLGTSGSPLKPSNLALGSLKKFSHSRGPGSTDLKPVTSSSSGISEFFTPFSQPLPIPINPPSAPAVHQLSFDLSCSTPHNTPHSQTFTLKANHSGRDPEVQYSKSLAHQSEAMSQSESSLQTVIYPLTSAINERKNSPLNDSLAKSSYKTATTKHNESPSFSPFSRKTTSNPIKSILLKSSSDTNRTSHSSERSSDFASTCSTLQISPSSTSPRTIFNKEHELNRPKEGVSIFSKLLKPGRSLLSKHKSYPEDQGDTDNEADYYENEESLRRQEGWKADVVSYVPDYPTHPSYIRVRSHHKKKRDFNRLFLAQELLPSGKPDGAEKLSSEPSATPSLTSIPKVVGSHCHVKTRNSNAIWALKFSKDGKYLAAAGQDRIIRIWKVIDDAARDVTQDEPDYFADTLSIISNCTSSTPHSRPPVQRIESKRQKKRVYAPVFNSKPIREFKGHTGDILDLSWSKNNFLLSSSMDKTVRLWHVDRSQCLCSFLHSDYVTSIKFHPQDDRFFLSGSLDSRLRLWSIPDKAVAYWREVPDLITALSFTPDGETAIVGCLRGQCLFYESNGLKYLNEIIVKSNRGKNSKGSKITGIEASRISFEQHVLNESTHTESFKDADGRDVYLLITTNDSRIRMYNAQTRTVEAKYKGHENNHSQIHASFSDDGKYVISGSENNKTFIWNAMCDEDETKKERLAYEDFESHESTVTAAIFAPKETRHLLVISHDPIYELCDPPPVILKAGSVADMQCLEARDEIMGHAKKSTHNDGHIIVTADLDGSIKVFRQDCAHFRRKMAQEALIIHSKHLSSNGALSPTTNRSSLFSHGISFSSASGLSRSGSGNRSSRSLRSQLSHSHSSCSITNISLYSDGSFNNTRYDRRHQSDVKSPQSRSPSRDLINGPYQRPQLPEISLSTDKGEEIQICGNHRVNYQSSSNVRRVASIQPFSVPIDAGNTGLPLKFDQSANLSKNSSVTRLSDNYSEGSNDTADADSSGAKNKDYAQYNGSLALNLNRRLDEFKASQKESGYISDEYGSSDKPAFLPPKDDGRLSKDNKNNENDQLVCVKCQGTDFKGKFINGSMTLICSSCFTPISS
ncbi:WD40 repeat-like protein [Nadsonia fulvescens var. elongata DSM 6958]|uniref:WD40 repeat-like protein n=1 Tax=Nadsonia fulvescens var. elongata DSM 6958 TaxID=857566 RepID=A0A1E3PIX1_9ASCO|nr:WD40 repeat-like protein [Nadsonia fulvescens var. elongata DSM 6958]